MSKSLTVSLIIISLIIGMGIGFYVTPEYAQMRENESSQMDLGSADARIDLRYVNGMIAHHQAAIYLAEQAILQTNRPEIRELAHTIISVDTADIASLYASKKSWYNDNRKVTEYSKINLGGSDDKFDLRFLNALLIHHDQAIITARELQTKSTRTEALNIADNVITSLTAGIQTLTTWRESWYGIR
jgi:uncharacterized protein (DUF305 family)